MSDFHRIAFAAEILLAELIFLFPAKKKKFFALRYMTAALTSALVSFFFSVPVLGIPQVVAQLLRLVVVFGVTVAGMYFCFDLKFSVVASACVAGYAVEHMTFHMILLVGRVVKLPADFSLWALPPWEMLEYSLFPFIYLIIAATVGVYSARHRCYQKVDPRLNTLSLIIMILTIGFTRFANAFGDTGSITVSLYSIASCVLALYVQLVLFRLIDLQHENDTIRLLWQEDQRQYEITKKTIETINIKHHDLKNRLSEINALLSEEDIRSIEDAVNAYDSKVKTGSEALDVLLTKNSLLCKAEGIALTYTGSGSDFSFMSTMDIYSLFGNAVDNAIEAVRRVENPEKKVIDIVTEKCGKMITIIITNYCNGQIKITDGMPVTTKAEEVGFHGFGMKSMRLLAEKYHGSLHVRLEEDVFVLTIILFDDAV